MNPWQRTVSPLPPLLDFSGSVKEDFHRTTVRALIHSLTQSGQPISHDRKPVERTNEIISRPVWWVHSVGFPQQLIWSYNWVRKWIRALMEQWVRRGSSWGRKELISHLGQFRLDSPVVHLVLVVSHVLLTPVHHHYVVDCETFATLQITRQQRVKNGSKQCLNTGKTDNRTAYNFIVPVGKLLQQQYEHDETSNITSIWYTSDYEQQQKPLENSMLRLKHANFF